MRAETELKVAWIINLLGLIIGVVGLVGFIFLNSLKTRLGENAFLVVMIMTLSGVVLIFWAYIWSDVVENELENKTGEDGEIKEP